MSKLFNMIRVAKPRMNSFDLSHERKMSLNMGKLYPMLVQEIIPGDIFRVNSEILIRLAPMLAPIMHRVNVYVHFFFVPNRLVFDKWEDFITGGQQGTSSITFPTLLINESDRFMFAKGTLADYLGVPPPPDTTITGSLTVSALPFRAYTKIFNEYYRDPWLMAEVDFAKGEVVDDYAKICTLRNRCWEKDYFTSALPYSQRGGEVNIPSLGQPVYADTSLIYRSGVQPPELSPAGPLQVDSDGELNRNGVEDVRVENLTSVNTEMAVNDLRRAVRLQEWLEKNARAGYRYIEQILSHFGVRSSDARLQRPEYLGGGKTPVTISEVLATAKSATNPIGEMLGHGISVGNTNSFKRRFEEHGIVMGILSVMPRTAYQQGVERLFLKNDKFDFFWPEFANLGEQEVFKSELYHDYTGPTDKTAFGYQSRYAEYKFTKSSVHGDFRDDLSFWHMGRTFDSLPGLNETFLKCVTDEIDARVFAVEDPNVHKLYAYLYNNVKALRPMPYFGEPSL